MAGRRTPEERHEHLKNKGLKRKKSISDPNSDGSAGATDTSGSPPEANAGGFNKPVRYDPEIAAEILKRMSLGDTLTAVCKEDGFPQVPTVYDWRKERPDFEQGFIQARLDQMGAWADQIITIADCRALEYVRDEDGKVLETVSGKYVMDRTGPQRSRVMIETRQWLMERVAREEYGLRQTLDVHMNLYSKDDDELLHELRQAAEAAGMSAAELAALVDEVSEELPAS